MEKNLHSGHLPYMEIAETLNGKFFTNLSILFPIKILCCTVYIHLHDSLLDASVMISLHCIFVNKNCKDQTNPSFSMFGECKPTSYQWFLYAKWYH